MTVTEPAVGTPAAIAVPGTSPLTSDIAPPAAPAPAGPVQAVPVPTAPLPVVQMADAAPATPTPPPVAAVPLAIPVPTPPAATPESQDAEPDGEPARRPAAPARPEHVSLAMLEEIGFLDE